MLRMRTLYCCVSVYLILCFVKPHSGDEIKAQDSELVVHRREDDGASQVDQVPLAENQHSPKMTGKDPALNLHPDGVHADQINRCVSRFQPWLELFVIPSKGYRRSTFTDTTCVFYCFLNDVK